MSTSPEILARLRAALTGRYAVEREIGRGGMATVFLARDLKHGRQVAIKVLNPDLANSIGSERFLREIKTTADLVHPNIIPLIDSGNADGLLYYIMPYITGESLRDKLDREKQLSLEETLRLAREIANALDYAHQRGIIHRDIKPDNILLVNHAHAMVSDFGLARALFAASNDALTATGLVVGTPFYISPEQAEPNRTIDGRADVYSLGCMLFELLAGEPPFHGKTYQAVINRHVMDERPSLRSRGVSAPVAVERAVARAMARVPAERFKTAGEFVSALECGAPASRRAWWFWLEQWRRGWKAAAVVTLLAIIAVVTSVLSSDRVRVIRDTFTGFIRPQLDTTRYIVLPFRHGHGVPAELNEEQMLHDALARWSGIVVVDQFQVADQTARLDTTRLSLDDASDVARKLGAGRFVWGDASRMGDSVRIHARVYDVARNNALLNDSTVRVAAGSLPEDPQIQALADALLFRGLGPVGRQAASIGTTSVPARQAFLRAQGALAEWDLASADSLLRRAVRDDPQYATAFLWLAEVRGWTLDDPPDWNFLASQAAAGAERLNAREKTLAGALLHLTKGEFVASCLSYDSLRTTDPHDFAAAYGSAECQARDSAVVRNPKSPSGWSFRSSYHQAASAYEAAFRLLPSIHKAFRQRAYFRLRRMLYTSSNRLRHGTSESAGGASFLAYPTLIADTLAFIPYPSEMFRVGAAQTRPAGVAAAVSKQKEAFRRIAATWSSAFPNSPDALNSLAIAFDLLGYPSAVDTLRKAMTLSNDPEETLRLATAEIWMLVRRGLPDGNADLLAARKLADSLLASEHLRHRNDARMLAPVAMLIGRGYLAARLARESDVSNSVRERPSVEADSRALLAFAAEGGPVDSLRKLEHRILSTIARTQPTATPLDEYDELGRSSGLAFPAYSFAALPALALSGDVLLKAEAAFNRGDYGVTRQVLLAIKATRKDRTPSELMVDALYPEAYLWYRLGEAKYAAQWIDPTLKAIASYPPEVFYDYAITGALVRLLLLRAQIAIAERDMATAQGWARALSTLISYGDGGFSDVNSEVRKLLQSP
jgi:serine/threonine protein kinase